MIDVKNQIVESLFLVFFIYFLVLTIVYFFFFAIFYYLDFKFLLKFFGIKDSNSVLIFLIANQFLIQKISEDISLFGVLMYIHSGGLFYFNNILIIKIFSNLHLISFLWCFYMIFSFTFE